MRSGISIILLLAIASTFFSCDANRVYEMNHDFADRTWNLMEQPEFEFKIIDPGQRFNVYYNVRNSLDYPYSRIFVTYHLQDSLGNELHSKLNTQHLFDEKTGAPLGSSGLGDIYDHRFLLLENYEFKQPGKYKLKLEQFTRQDTLTGVLAVGVRVETAISPVK